jgi:hypothetical protein
MIFAHELTRIGSDGKRDEIGSNAIGYAFSPLSHQAIPPSGHKEKKRGSR